VKKLKAWQVVLMVIFYPVGITYLIYRLCKKQKSQSVKHSVGQSGVNYDFDVVFVNKGSKVYHCDQMCADSRSYNSEEMKEKAAVKKGLRPCHKCYGQGYKYQ